MRSETIWTITTVLIHAIAVALLLISLVGSSWAVIQYQHGMHVLSTGEVTTLNGEVTASYGLWEHCFTNTTICVRINHFYRNLNADWFKAVQIATATACMFGITAFVASILKPCMKDCASVIAALNMFIAWICITGALAVFTAKEPTNDEVLMEKRVWGWTFMVGWASCGVTFLASVIAWLAYTPRKEQPEVDMLFIQ